MVGAAPNLTYKGGSRVAELSAPSQDPRQRPTIPSLRSRARASRSRGGRHQSQEISGRFGAIIPVREVGRPAHRTNKERSGYEEQVYVVVGIRARGRRRSLGVRAAACRAAGDHEPLAELHASRRPRSPSGQESRPRLRFSAQGGCARRRSPTRPTTSTTPRSRSARRKPRRPTSKSSGIASAARRWRRAEAAPGVVLRRPVLPSPRARTIRSKW